MSEPDGVPPTAGELRAELIDPRVSRELRRTVLRGDGDRDAALPGDDLTDAVHLGAFTPDRWLASTCFIYPERPPWFVENADTAWHLRQMATDPRFRGIGAGAAVLRTAVDYVSAVGGRLLWCDARETAIGFYAAHGWQVEGERHLAAEPPIPHFYMWRPVPVAEPINAEDF